MCIVALFYSNPRFEFDFNANDHFEFSKWFEYIFAKLGIYCKNDLLFIDIIIGIFQFVE
jgi:hypothetical protein